MSGGRFDYMDDRLCSELFGWEVSTDYGDKAFEQSKIARRINPMEDLVISELVFDVLCLIHSYDWYVCGDTNEEIYRADVARFKAKWLKAVRGKRAKEIVDEELETMRKKLYQAFEVEVQNGTTDI